MLAQENLEQDKRKWDVKPSGLRKDYVGKEQAVALQRSLMAPQDGVSGTFAAGSLEALGQLQHGSDVRANTPAAVTEASCGGETVDRERGQGKHFPIH